MNRRTIGTALVTAAMLAASFLAGGLLIAGGSSPATGSETAVEDSGPAVTVTQPTAAAKPAIAPTATPAPETEPPAGNLVPVEPEESTGESEATSQPSSGAGNTQQDPPAPVAPAPQPPAPMQPAVPEPETNEPEAPQPPVVEPEPAVEEEPAEAEEEPLPFNEPPFVAKASPQDGQTGLGLKPVIQVEFSEPMDQTSVEAAFSVNPAIAGAFSWDEAGQTMKFTPSGSFAYNDKVQWQIAKSATDASGLAMVEDFQSGFNVLRQKTITLYSQAHRDGHVFAPPVQVLGPKVVTKSDNGHNSLLVGSWMRGFLSFDLAKLPANTVDITAAQLHIHQRDHHPDAYGPETGALWIVSLPYGDLDAGDYQTPTPTICPNLCYPLGVELSSDAGNGWKSADLTPLVRADWNNTQGDLNGLAPAVLERLSQFRLQFLNENQGAGPSVWAEFHSGESSTMGPKLQVTYVYP